MGESKISNVVDAMNEFGPASIGLLAFEWVHLIKSNMLKDKLTESSASKIKVQVVFNISCYWIFKILLAYFIDKKKQIDDSVFFGFPDIRPCCPELSERKRRISSLIFSKYSLLVRYSFILIR
jgi:hypothetical protein